MGGKNNQIKKHNIEENDQVRMEKEKGEKKNNFAGVSKTSWSRGQKLF